MPLVLRRANVSRKGGSWQDEDCDVFDGARRVGRIFLDANNTWFWGVDFQLEGLRPRHESITEFFRREVGLWC
jgi:hypothetical protein